MDSLKKNNPVYSTTDSSKVTISEEEWKKILPKDIYSIAREKGTERPWSSAFEHSKEIGTYYCAACHLPLFSSKTKFESGTGWPSFYEPLKKAYVDDHRDESYGMVRNEVVCARCDSHLGHVFDDGPKPTGKRFCMNSASLFFVKAK